MAGTFHITYRVTEEREVEAEVWAESEEDARKALEFFDVRYFTEGHTYPSSDIEVLVEVMDSDVDETEAEWEPDDEHTEACEAGEEKCH